MSIQIGVQIRKFCRFVVFLAVISTLATGIFFIQSKVFEIQTIEVAASGVSVILDEKKMTNNLLFFSPEKIRRMLLDENILLADVRFTKKYPHTLIVEPVLRTPVGRLTTQTGIVVLVQSLRFAEAVGGQEVISSITARDGPSLVATIGETDILFTQDVEVETVATTLQTLLTGFRIKGSLPKTIDLRFDKPIVTF
ncbi:MAG: hypothetical protein UY16_C0003G0029 [Candidatus Gottesmanbacteria bacterium GW2011_GWA2_47_9]|uniref:POTRA domain-containing protein n=1 Tax=Candidatus Gottesmanbacteria bacterium GW2011_GWA2_47_9 TaxID=1618445 RepID=A0A0G1U3N9_9BACT|nr:MAG: hypothetical protein UY16_C0003G0029 [Candidatus Gottesmanbacteria bacterium GW2011_GWA2_47_9]